MSISNVLSRTWRELIGGATDEPTDNSRAAARRRRRSSGAVVTAMVMGVLAISAPATAAPVDTATRLPARTTTESSIGKAVRNLINSERAAHGLRPVYMNKDLLQSARVHDVNMARANDMSHHLKGEPNFGKRMEDAGYRWIWAGENIAWNSEMTEAGVLELEKLMYHEHAPDNGHRLNILSPHYRNVGVDVYMDTVHHKVWLTCDFGRA